MKLSKALNSPLYGRISFNEPLSAHTSIKAGGPADVWIEPESIQQLRRLVQDARRTKISVFTIGQGCNIIVGKNGIKGLCVRLNSPTFKTIKFNGKYVSAGAGVALRQLIASASERSLGGYEFLSGIPGTMGGAIFGNAGARGKAIARLLREVEVLTPGGNMKRLKPENIKFGYRRSGLDGNIIISAKLELEKADKGKILALLKANLKEKIKNQDYAAPSAGCIFKNPSGGGFSAGKLIDNCCLKGKSIGDAQVSFKHANFIINKGSAKAEDIISLINLVKKKVKRVYSVNLEEEVKIIK